MTVRFQALMPTEISLNGYCVAVKYVENIQEYGLYDLGSRIIYISTNNHKNTEEVLSTLYHELMHAVMDHTGLRELCSDLSDSFEEAIVATMERFFVNVVVLSKKSWTKRKRVEFTHREAGND